MSSSSISRPILFIDHTARLGGGEIALLNLVNAIDATRYTPTVVLFADGPLRERLEVDGIRTLVEPLSADIADARKDLLGGGSLLKLASGIRLLAFIWRLRGLIRHERPAVVHANSLKADVLGGIAARLAGVPVVWHVRDRIADDYLPPRVARVFRSLARRIPTIVIANSQSTLDTLGKNTRGAAISLGAVDVRSQVIHDGTIFEDVAPSVSSDAGRPLSIGLVGRITRWKGQHVFIEVARLLRSRFPGARYQIIGSAMFGETEYEQDLHNTVERDGLSGLVEFTGFREDVSSVIAGLDVLVHASITGEPFGQVIIEGMTAAKPVVATRGGGVPEIVDDGVTGLLVPMDDAPAMAEAVGRLLADPALRYDMGQQGRRRVAEHFTIRHTADKVMRVYDELLRDTRPGRGS